MTSKTQHVGRGSVKQQFEAFAIWRLVEQWDLRNIIASTKTHTHIQIDKPKQRETPMKSQTQHVDGGVVPRVFMRQLYELVEQMNGQTWDLRKTSRFNKAYKSKSLSQSRRKRIWNQKHDTLMVAVRNRMFIGFGGKWMNKMRCKKKRRFNKDIQIQIGEPK